MAKKKTPDIDFEAEFGGTEPGAEQIKAIERAVIQAAKIDQEIKELDQLLKHKKADLHKIIIHQLPDALAAANLQEIVTENGTRVKLEEIVSGSLPNDPEKREAALKWLEENDAKDLIETEMSFHFERGQHNSMNALASAADELGLEHEDRSGVHHMKLKSFIKERMKRGEKTPYDLLGIFIGRKAKIQPPKGKK